MGLHSVMALDWDAHKRKKKDFHIGYEKPGQEGRNINHLPSLLGQMLLIKD